MKHTSNLKRKQILATGKELFWKFGFKRVTIEEICKAAGVSKMTFYKFFPNKSELARTILDEVFEDSLQKIDSLQKEHKSPGETLKKIIRLKAEGTRNISKEFIKDLYTSKEGDLKGYMEEKSRMMFAEMVGVYERGKVDGWVRKDLNIPFFLLYVQKSIDMFSNDEVLQFFDTSQEMIMEITNLFIYGISPHK